MPATSATNPEQPSGEPVSAPPGPTLAPGQRCRVLVYDVASASSRVLYETFDLLLEAANWVSDGLILNGDGTLWALGADGATGLTPIEIDGVPDLNNDHVPSPDGEHMFVSANDFQIYRVPLSGGRAERITDPSDAHLHFLHGVSPDGTRLAYTAVKFTRAEGIISADIHTIGVDGTGDRAITGGGIADGSEYSPDGEWIYFNTEQFSSEPGHAQIARMRPDGSEIEQLTFDERVNWFPHFSPDGACIVYLSFPPGTQGHPGNLDVELKLVVDGQWDNAATIVQLFGGQGTINVNSCAPEGDRFAYVDYPTGPA